MVLSTDSIKQFAKLQSTPDGLGLGAIFYVPANIVEQVAEDGADSIEYTLKAVPEGILIEIGGEPR